MNETTSNSNDGPAKAGKPKAGTPHKAPAATDAPSPDPALASTVAAGPDVESTLAERVRTWVDVLGWLRLLRVCRLAGSPVWVAATTAWVVVWGLSIITLLGPATPAKLGDAMVRWPAGWVLECFSLSGDRQLAAESPTGSLEMASWARTQLSRWRFIAVSLVTILLLTPLAIALTRVGGLLTAGRDMPSFFATWRWVGRRCGGGYLVALLPAIGCLPLLLTLQLIRWLSIVLGETLWMVVTLPITVPCLILVGFLLAGSKSAVPLGWAALGLESDPDAVDALSRGYEMTLRRLVHLVGFGLVAIVLIAIMVAGWTLVGWTASRVVLFPNAAVIADGWHPRTPSFWLLGVLPLSILVMMSAGMTGGIYLLLRQSAGGQEVEDVLEDPSPQPLDVPSVGRG